ncbi:MAG: hypothetical protein B7Z37_03195 [Verrucomicrobia bacterium 12-59-8]|nr:MAG: hypothetical protein B7Z37_03195 [Verrucomicrobia bacterium 12-59-8]
MPALGKDLIRKLMGKQAKPKVKVGDYMTRGGSMEMSGIVRNIENTLEDVNLPYKADTPAWSDPYMKSPLPDTYENVPSGLPPQVGPSPRPPTPPKVTKKDRAKAERRGWKQGFRTTAFMGSGKAWDPTIERGNGSKIRWFADKPDPAYSYMEGKQQTTSNWARNDPNPIEDNANMAPVKLKLGKTLVVNGNGRVWDQLSPKGIKDKAAREALEPFAYNGRLSTDEIARKAEEMGFDSVTFRDIKDYIAGNSNVPAHNVYAMINQKNIRGKYAKFENKNRGKLADLLAGGVGAAGVSAALSSQDDQA